MFMGRAVDAVIITITIKPGYSQNVKNHGCQPCFSVKVIEKVKSIRLD